METKKQEEHLLERLDEIEFELNVLTHKKYELEERRKYLLKKINELDSKYIKDNCSSTVIWYIKTIGVVKATPQQKVII
jgi:hypothetical protein